MARGYAAVAIHFITVGNQSGGYNLTAVGFTQQLIVVDAADKSVTYQTLPIDSFSEQPATRFLASTTRLSNSTVLLFGTVAGRELGVPCGFTTHPTLGKRRYLRRLIAE
jgi:hypothetical protein